MYRKVFEWEALGWEGTNTYHSLQPGWNLPCQVVKNPRQRIWLVPTPAFCHRAVVAAVAVNNVGVEGLLSPASLAGRQSVLLPSVAP